MMARLRSLLMPAVFALIVGALLIALGIWQLHRLTWKEALIARIETRAKATPQPLPKASAWDNLRPADYDYRHVALDGTFRNGRESFVFHGSDEGPGYLVLTPLDLATGGTVIVNRGFIPENLKDHRSGTITEPKGTVHLTGLMRPPERRNLFTPADEPAKNLFFTRDAQQISAQLNLGKVAPFVVDADAIPDANVWPHGGTTELALPNNHLSYALTWFGLALALLGVFTSFAWRRLVAGDAGNAIAARRQAASDRQGERDAFMLDQRGKSPAPSRDRA